MPPTKTIGQQCVEQMQAAKATAKAAGRTLDWSEVAAIIDALCPQKAQKTPNKADSRPGARLALAEAIYAAYPRHIGREAALKAIGKAAERLNGEVDPLAYLLQRTELYAKAVALWPESERQYVPYPSTWFNQGRYLDDPKEWARGTEQPTTPAGKDYTKL